MLRILRIVVCLFAGAALVRGADLSLTDARQAQAKLGPEVWSEVIRIENVARVSRYPSSLHALVFEVVGILWIYTDGQGTQSLSQYVGRTAEEKANLGPLLRAIEPGFVRWTVVPDSVPAPVTRRRDLRNGCFIESLAALRERRERGEVIANARLLSYYFYPGVGRPGHTVLAYGTDHGVEVVDPLAAIKAREFPPALANDPLGLAQALAGHEVARARWLPLDLPTRGRLFSDGGLIAGGGGWGDVTAW